MTDKPKPPETPGMSEVSAKFVDEAEAVVGDETATEDAVVVLRQRWESVRAERDQLKNRDDENPQHPDVLEDKRLHDVQCDIEDLIANTPTHTAAGVAVKLRQLQTDDEDFDGMSSWRPAAFRTALEALDRGTMPAIEDPILALKREWEARYKALDEQRETGDDSDEARQPFFDRLQETEDQLLRTPATTPAGIAIKLILWARLNCTADEVSGLSWNHKSIQGRPLDLGGQPVLSALLDLERMAGEGPIINEVAASEGYGDVHRWLTESAKKGNEKARSALIEDFDWQNMSFVRCQDTGPVVQWPPVELTSQHGDSVYGAACVIGNHCALDLIGHIKSHSKCYDGGRLLDVVQEIAKRGEWDGFEVGFFSVLGNFIAWGRVPISGDFDAVLAEEARS